MEKATPNKTLWVFKRAEMISNPHQRKPLVETQSGRSSAKHTSLGKDASKPKLLSYNPTPKTRRKDPFMPKTRSISDLPSIAIEKSGQISLKTNKSGHEKDPSFTLPQKYLPNLPSIKQIHRDMLIPERDLLRNDDEMLSPSDLFESPLVKKRLLQIKKIDLEGNVALSCRYNMAESLIALGCQDGCTRIAGTSNARIHKIKTSVMVPVTSVRWSPRKENVLFQTKANGTVEIIDNLTGSLVFSFVEEGNFINCSDLNLDGSLFSTAGQDARMRVYDSEKPDKVLHIYSRLANPTHANRIYSLRFHPDNRNLLASGGWDESLILWDMRSPNSIDFIYGPLICGDSMDLRGSEILTGSWRDSKPLQIWDLRTLKEKASIEWNLPSQGIQKEKGFIYSCIFEKKYGKYIIAGSSGVNEIRLYENGKNYECLDTEEGFKKGIYSMDSSLVKNQFCYASEKSGVYSHY